MTRKPQASTLREKDEEIKRLEEENQMLREANRQLHATQGPSDISEIMHKLPLRVDKSESGQSVINLGQIRDLGRKLAEEGRALAKLDLTFKMQYDGYLIRDDISRRMYMRKTEPTQEELQKLAVEIEKECGRTVSGFWIDRVTPEEPLEVEIINPKMEKALKHLIPFTTCIVCGAQIPRRGLRGAVRCDKCRLVRNRIKKKEYYHRRKKLMRPRKIYDANTPLT